MTSLFSKPLDSVDADDIRSLIGQVEGQLFEIKRELPTRKGRVDPWYTKPQSGQSQRQSPSDYAKREIFQELVAFANADGGWLVIGLEESGNQPRQAVKVQPLPDCHDLAERLERATGDWIDPPLPSVRCRGIEMKGNPRDGVVVCRVPPSPVAPHRLNKSGLTQVAHIRRNDESKEMSMREIQDLTLDRARGQVRVDEAFTAMRKCYEALHPTISEKRRLLGYRITLVPATRPLAIDRPYLHEELFTRRKSITGRSPDGSIFDLTTMDYSGRVKPNAGPVRPGLRSGRRLWVLQYHPDFPRALEDGGEEDLCAIDVFSDGTVNVSVKTTNIKPPALSVHWILADLANALHITDHARVLGGNPDAEYVLEIEIRYDDHHITGSGTSPVIDGFILGLLGEKAHTSSTIIERGPLLLPHYPAGSRSSFLNLLKLVMNDLHNAVHKEHRIDFAFLPLDDTSSQ